jgi:hypothetical protein
VIASASPKTRLDPGIAAREARRRQACTAESRDRATVDVLGALVERGGHGLGFLSS